MSILQKVWGAGLILFLTCSNSVAADDPTKLELQKVLDSINTESAEVSAQKILKYISIPTVTQKTKDTLKEKWEAKWKATKGSFDQFVNKGGDSGTLMPLNPPLKPLEPPLKPLEPPLKPLEPPLKPLHPPIDSKEADRIYQYYTKESAQQRIINEDALDKQVSKRLASDIKALQSYLDKKPTLSSDELYYRTQLLKVMKVFLNEKAKLAEQQLGKMAAELLDEYSTQDENGNQVVNESTIAEKPALLLEREASGLEQYLDASTDLSSDTRNTLEEILAAIKRIIAKTKFDMALKESVSALMQKYISDNQLDITKIKNANIGELKAAEQKFGQYYLEIQKELSPEANTVFKLLKAISQEIKNRATPSGAN